MVVPPKLSETSNITKSKYSILHHVDNTSYNKYYNTIHNMYNINLCNIIIYSYYIYMIIYVSCMLNVYLNIYIYIHI